MKKLQLTFMTDGNGKFNVNIAEPKDDLDKAFVEAAAAKIQPVLETSKNAHAIGFDKGVIITTTKEEIQ